MNDDEINRQLTKVFHTVFANDAITLKRQMVAPDIQGWDSLTHVQLILAVEARFSIRFKLSEIGSFETVGEMMDAIKRHVAAK